MVTNKTTNKTSNKTSKKTSNKITNETSNKTKIEYIPDEYGITDSPVDPFVGLSEKQIMRATYENKFNMVMIFIFDHVTKYYANEDVATAQEQINQVLLERPDGPISCFLMYVYMNDSYRTNLLKGDIGFFYDESRLKDDEIKELTQDKLILDRIFAFKKIWTDFSLSTKLFIMRSLRGMVLISREYINYLE